jgi:hypothetical protein
VLDSVIVGAKRAAALMRSPDAARAGAPGTVPSIGVDARLAKLLR